MKDEFFAVKMASAELTSTAPPLAVEISPPVRIKLSIVRLAYPISSNILAPLPSIVRLVPLLLIVKLVLLISGSGPVRVILAVISIISPVAAVVIAADSSDSLPAG